MDSEVPHDWILNVDGQLIVAYLALIRKFRTASEDGTRQLTVGVTSTYGGVHPVVL